MTQWLQPSSPDFPGSDFLAIQRQPFPAVAQVAQTVVCAMAVSSLPLSMCCAMRAAGTGQSARPLNGKWTDKGLTCLVAGEKKASKQECLFDYM